MVYIVQPYWLGSIRSPTAGEPLNYETDRYLLQFEYPCAWRLLLLMYSALVG
jgi:hypothetical protein